MRQRQGCGRRVALEVAVSARLGCWLSCKTLRASLVPHLELDLLHLMIPLSFSLITKRGMPAHLKARAAFPPAFLPPSHGRMLV